MIPLPDEETAVSSHVPLVWSSEEQNILAVLHQSYASRLNVTITILVGSSNINQNVLIADGTK